MQREPAARIRRLFRVADTDRRGVEGHRRGGDRGLGGTHGGIDPGGRWPACGSPGGDTRVRHDPRLPPTWKPHRDISTSDPRAQRARCVGGRRRWLVWTGAGLTLLAAVVAGGNALNPWWTGFSGPARPGPRVWIATGWSRACYDGMSLRGWKTIDGRWIPGRDDGEGGKLLAGTDGTISFPWSKVRVPSENRSRATRCWRSSPRTRRAPPNCNSVSVHPPIRTPRNVAW